MIDLGHGVEEPDRLNMSLVSDENFITVSDIGSLNYAETNILSLDGTSFTLDTDGDLLEVSFEFNNKLGVHPKYSEQVFAEADNLPISILQNDARMNLSYLIMNKVLL